MINLFAYVLTSYNGLRYFSFADKYVKEQEVPENYASHFEAITEDYIVIQVTLISRTATLQKQFYIMSVH